MCLRNPSPRITGARETGFSPSRMDTHPIKKLEGKDARICWRTRDEDPILVTRLPPFNNHSASRHEF